MFTEARAAAAFMHPAYKHSGAASNCYFLMCSAHLMRVQQSSIFLLLTCNQRENMYSQAHQTQDIYFLEFLSEKYLRRQSAAALSCALLVCEREIIYIIDIVLRRMGNNKAQAHHTSTYFHARRVSIQLNFIRNPAGFLACPSVSTIAIARAVPVGGPRYYPGSASCRCMRVREDVEPACPLRVRCGGDSPRNGIFPGR